MLITKTGLPPLRKRILATHWCQRLPLTLLLLQGCSLLVSAHTGAAAATCSGLLLLPDAVLDLLLKPTLLVPLGAVPCRWSQVFAECPPGTDAASVALLASEQGTLDAFHRLFDGVEFEKGLEICFTQRPNAQLVTRIKGASAGIISSKALCRSLFGAYLGPDPVVKDAKAGLGSALSMIVL
ncbi:MAG: hypothetical protein WDW38_011136 [Sanguina aurantia]